MATPRAAAGRVNLGATSAKRLRAITQHLMRAHFLLFAHITKVIFANERSNANTYVASFVPPITRAILSVPSRADSSVAIRNANRDAGSLVHRVWSRANGGVPTTHVR